MGSRLLRGVAAAITARVPVLSWLEAWRTQVRDAQLRAIFEPTRPLTWADLNPWARNAAPASPPDAWPNP